MLLGTVIDLIYAFNFVFVLMYCALAVTGAVVLHRLKEDK